MSDQDLQFKLKRVAARVRASSGDRLAFCLALAGQGPEPPRPEFAYAQTLLAPLAQDARLYWIGTLYSLMLGKDQRKRQAAYFTPPALADRLISLAEAQGCDLRHATVLDPAAGGAAFLATVGARMRAVGRAPEDCMAALKGIELDPDLAILSRALIGRSLDLDLPVRGGSIRTGDALKLRPGAPVDLVLANPPFGRRLGDGLNGIRWRWVASPGHVNLYALFTALALRSVKPGGLVGLVIPASFVGGPFYDRLRQHIRRRAQVLSLGMVDNRDDHFLDVAQDVCLLLLRRQASGHLADASVSFGTINAQASWIDTGRAVLPPDPAAPWELPPQQGEGSAGGATLADYGVNVQAGYFVWNREKDRLREHSGDGAVPLYWACNIRPGEVCLPRARKREGVDYVAFEQPSSAVIHDGAVLLQRVTNSRQKRRLVPGLAPASPEGFTTENHVILLRPTRPDADLALVCALLNTQAADDRYRRLSGTASLSVKLLRRLDLPRPDVFSEALARLGDPERAAAEAFGADARRSAA